MAAGLGSRYGGLKQIDPVGPSGETLLDYSLFDARRAGFGKIVFVIRRDIEAAFREAVGRRYEARAEVAYAFQSLEDLPPGFRVPASRTKPWGTGQAVLAGEPAISGPFAVVNADDFYGRESYEALHAFLAGGPPADLHALVAFRLDRTLSAHGPVARGLCDVGAGRAPARSPRGDGPRARQERRHPRGRPHLPRRRADVAQPLGIRPFDLRPAARPVPGLPRGARRGGEGRVLPAGRRGAAHRGGDGARPRPGDAEPVVRDDAPRGRESGLGVAARPRRGGGVSGSALGG